MKKFLNFYTAALFLSLAVLVACGGSDPVDEADPAQDQADYITQATATLQANGVSLNGQDPVLPAGETWDNFTINFSGDKTGGTITTTNVPAGYEVVWPASTTWTMSSTDVTSLERGDGVIMTVKEGSTSDMTISFSISTGRTMVLEGAWIFNVDFPN